MGIFSKKSANDRSEWRVQAFVEVNGEAHGYEPQLVVGEARARRAAEELLKSYPPGTIRVECTQWDSTKDRNAADAARFGIKPIDPPQ